VSGGLQVKGVEAGYGPLRVLGGVEIEAAPGELVAVIGANGAGKSTLLRCISGLLPLRRGEITFDGRRLDGLAPAAVVRLGVAHVPERRQIFAELSVAENLELGGFAAGVSGAELRSRAAGLVDNLFPALHNRLGEQAGALSGGQQQMLAIARGLMLRPRLLMLDEPSQGLAPLLVKEVFQVLQRMRSSGVVILLVEQNARQTLAIADRAYVLQNGRVALGGAGRDLLDDPEVERRYLGVGAAAGGSRGDSELAARLRAALA
jgi:branched-chain amino acid transport system ATP-binding protein